MAAATVRAKAVEDRRERAAFLDCLLPSKFPDPTPTDGVRSASGAVDDGDGTIVV